MILVVWEYLWISMIIGGIIILIILLVKAIGEAGGGTVRFYYRLLPLRQSSDNLLDQLQVELGRRGTYSVKQGDELVIDDIVAWRVRLEEHGGERYISLEAGLKTWYLIVSIIGLILFFIVGAILGVLAYLKYSEKRDALRVTLLSLTKDTSMATLI